MKAKADAADIIRFSEFDYDKSNRESNFHKLQLHLDDKPRK